MNPETGTERICVRQCMGCMQRFDRRLLTRYVNAGGRAVPDHEMKIQSRGAYVCHSGKCLGIALKSGRLKSRLKLAAPPTYLLGNPEDK